MNVTQARQIISDRYDKLIEKIRKILEIRGEKVEGKPTEQQIQEVLATDPFLAGQFHMLSSIMLDWVTQEMEGKSS